MRRLETGAFSAGASPLRIARASFAEAPSVLRLIQGAVEAGCARHYRPAQRRAVYLSYAQTLFVDVMGPPEAFTASVAGNLVGYVQMNREAARLSALFVAADQQGQGYGRVLLDFVIARAVTARLRRLHGAMSLNAVPFYALAGFAPCEGRRHLLHQGVVVPVLPMEKLLG